MTYIENRLTPEHRAELIAFLARGRPKIREVAEWFAQHGHTVQMDAAANCRARLGPPGRNPHPLKVDLLLTPDDRVVYLSVIRDARTTVAKAKAWLNERGYPIGVTAIRNHLRERRHLESDIRLAAETAAALGRIVRAEGSAVMSEGMLTRFEQLMMEQLVSARREVLLSVSELFDMSRTVSNAVESRQVLEDGHRTTDRVQRAKDRAADKATKKKHEITPREVAERIREVLGA